MRNLYALLPLAFLISGCFNLKQEFRVSEDGTTTTNIRIAIAAAALSVFDGTARNDLCSNFLPEDEGLKVTARAENEGGDYVCDLTIKGETEAVFTSLAEGSVSDFAGARSPLVYHYSKDDDVHQFSVDLKFGAQGSADGKSQFGNQLITMLAAGRSLSWSITAPDIVSTTGKLSGDKKTASYSVPLATMISGNGGIDEFEVKFRTTKPGFWNWLTSKF